METRGLAVIFCFMVVWLIPLQQLLLAASVEDVALLKASNREKILVEGAKKEGKVNFYTGLIVDQVVRPVKDALKGISLSANRILPRELGTSRTKSFGRVPGQKIRSRRHQRQRGGDDGTARRLHAAVLFA